MINSVIGRLRLIGNAEGISYIVLLGIAMPLKYWADVPEAVKIVGALHGFLFILFLLALVHVWIVRKWPIFHVFLAFLSAFIPFGTFVLDKKLRKG
ncbi:DUF3817 domain-containing protein [Paenibacillus sp. sptzw28]|uniref:DUF3817 domain-containing protein n=1 Tax=Paenibacillus sp. sptzw28 TaxID=715179 RepID=UPI001C6DFF08|nr:DUF3817 domain-containing protein [Paenibacillus sp. sptzw28]QYR19557.1 DUF3817 domain-containing protein [Paenibacillus sp. sptzw28]